MTIDASNLQSSSKNGHSLEGLGLNVLILYRIDTQVYFPDCLLHRCSITGYTTEEESWCSEGKKFHNLSMFLKISCPNDKNNIATTDAAGQKKGSHERPCLGMKQRHLLTKICVVLKMRANYCLIVGWVISSRQIKSATYQVSCGVRYAV